MRPNGHPTSTTLERASAAQLRLLYEKLNIPLPVPKKRGKGITNQDLMAGIRKALDTLNYTETRTVEKLMAYGHPAPPSPPPAPPPPPPIRPLETIQEIPLYNPARELELEAEIVIDNVDYDALEQRDDCFLISAPSDNRAFTALLQDIRRFGAQGITEKDNTGNKEPVQCYYFNRVTEHDRIGGGGGGAS
jgi:hypothetical protein